MAINTITATAGNWLFNGEGFAKEVSGFGDLSKWQEVTEDFKTQWEAEHANPEIPEIGGGENFLTEVPNDGKVYGRTHGEWVEVGDGNWKYWGNITPTKDTIKYKFMPLSEAKEVYIVIKRTTKTGSGITWFGVIDNLLTSAGICYSNNYTQDWAAHIIADIETKSVRSDFNFNMNPQALLIDNRIIAENKWGISFGSADSIAGDEVIHIWYK